MNGLKDAATAIGAVAAFLLACCVLVALLAVSGLLTSW